MGTWEERMARRAHRYSDYSDEQIVKLGDSVFNQLVQQEAPQYAGSDYDSAKYAWNAAPDESDTNCLLCYEWRRSPVGQRHFGYAWWRTCSDSCECQHHKDEVWTASSVAA